MSVGVGRAFGAFCLFVRSIAKMNDPKVFKLGIGDDLGIPLK